MKTTIKKGFRSGSVVMTKAVSIEFPSEVCMKYLARHLSGDWGDMTEYDKKLNDEALATGQDRIFSSYETEYGKLWIITEWDRSYTTLLTPDDY